MKKILTLFIFLLLPITVNAESRIISHYIDAEIEIAGGLRVKELIIVEGDFNSFSRNINYKMVKEDWDQKTIDFKSSPIYNGYSLENVNVSAFPIIEELDFNTFGDNVTFFEEYKKGDKTQENKYTVINNDLGRTYNIFKKTNNERYGFYYEYLVGNIVVAHEDIMEVNYTFRNLAIGAEETILRFILPYPTQDEKYNFWLHGPTTTKLKELTNSNDDKLGFLAQAENLTKNLNVRMTLPKEHVGIDIYLNHSKVEALPSIIQIEKELLEAYNLSTNVLNIVKYIIIAFGILYAVGSLILLKQSNKVIIALYLVFGIILTVFNYLFNYHFIWLYLILICPLGILLIQKSRKV